MVGMRKTRGTPQADEELFESVANGQEPKSTGVIGTNDLGTASPSSKALEAIPGVATKTADDSSEDNWEGGGRQACGSHCAPGGS